MRQWSCSPPGRRSSARRVRDTVKAGYAYVVLDGTLIPVHRVAADRPFYSGKHRKHGMNTQVIASPGSDILWVSGALPSSVHDREARVELGILDELEAVTLVTPRRQGATRAPRTRRSRTGEEQAWKEFKVPGG
jgi:hypothetical protein